jgi:hypothetical protein
MMAIMAQAVLTTWESPACKLQAANAQDLPAMHACCVQSTLETPETTQSSLKRRKTLENIWKKV